MDRCIEVLQGAFNARVAIGKKSKRAALVVLCSTAAVGATLLPDLAVQKAIAQHATEHGERRRIWVGRGNGSIGFGAKAHLGIGGPTLALGVEGGAIVDLTVGHGSSHWIVAIGKHALHLLAKGVDPMLFGNQHELARLLQYQLMNRL